uniref:WH2 domain-containing protein n=1 Tax=Ditylenchus dipsaci TaxID=166011 RepID=A0A915E2I9_9BILA
MPKGVWITHHHASVTLKYACDSPQRCVSSNTPCSQTATPTQTSTVANGSHGRPLPQPPPTYLLTIKKEVQLHSTHSTLPTVELGNCQWCLLTIQWSAPTLQQQYGQQRAPSSTTTPPSLLQGPPAANGGSGPPKPPPPPPMKIQAGPKLKHVDAPAPDKPPTATNPPNSRDNMMMQIKQGTQLKKLIQMIPEPQIGHSHSRLRWNSWSLSQSTGERRKNMMNSEDSDESAADNESEWKIEHFCKHIYSQLINPKIF